MSSGEKQKDYLTYIGGDIPHQCVHGVSAPIKIKPKCLSAGSAPVMVIAERSTRPTGCCCVDIVGRTDISFQILKAVAWSSRTSALCMC